MDGRIHNDDRQAAVRRSVGIAALRRLHRLVEAERAQDDADARAVPKVIAAVVALALVLLVLPLAWRLIG